MKLVVIKEGGLRADRLRLKKSKLNVRRAGDRSGHSSMYCRCRPARPIGRYVAPPRAQVPAQRGQWDGRDAGSGWRRAERGGTAERARGPPAVPPAVRPSEYGSRAAGL